ncbi:MAG: undecaprenyl-diphosphate phosphatase [Armatimonadetes bacterium]|nr:undecaprenyl-diphosphate phosphatase [Armatimonadota bacterium]
MSLLDAIVLGAVQGLTELLPVSSSAHLVLVPAALGWEEPSVAFAVAVHVGTACTLCVYFRRDIGRLLGGTWRWARRSATSQEQAQEAREDARWLGLLLLATAPAALAGPLLEDAVGSLLGSPATVGGLLLVTAAILLVSSRLSRGEAGRAAPTWKDALGIGFAQVVAMLPGLSRSGSTIGAGLALGLEPRVAVRFAFLMSIPVILGGGLLEGIDLVRAGVPTDQWVPLLVGAVVAGACAWLAIVLVFGAVRRGKLAWYALYCALVGLAALAATLIHAYVLSGAS